MTQTHPSAPKEILKIVIYIFTAAACFFSAFYEQKLKDRLTEGVAEEDKFVSEYGPINDIRLRMKHERYLENLPRERLSKYRLAIALKLFFLASLVAEVIVFQR